MSDFFSQGWGIWITVVVLAGMAFCLALLVLNRHRPSNHPGNTTGHVWDETIVELNNPMPRWWVGMFVITVVFALAYLWIYPGLVAVGGNSKWTSAGQYESEMAKAQENIKKVYSQYAEMPPEQLSKEAKAMDMGKRLFLNNCAVCHGSAAAGGSGFPNLTDTDWLHGGDIAAIKQSIDKGRNGVMPPMAAAVGSADDVLNVAHYVMSLSGRTHDSIRAQLGQPKFAACAACHGAEGKGNTAMGAPNLTDKTWLHGLGRVDDVVKIVTGGKNNVMPPQGHRFTPEQLHVLATYVWQLSPRESQSTAAAPANTAASAP